MTEFHWYPPPGWLHARRHYLVAPLVALLLAAALEQSWLGDLLEDLTIDFRFKVRAHFDPPADPRLVFVGIDLQSLDKFGMYPWKRTVMAQFLTELAPPEISPHTVAFDILYTEPTKDDAGADQALGDAAGMLPSVITASLGVDPSGKPSVIKEEQDRTVRVFKDTGMTSPLTNIHGDPTNIRTVHIAILPVEPLRKQSLFGFANDEPSLTDDIRHVIPLVIRVNSQVFPSLALQTLCQMLNVDAKNVEVNVGKSVVLKSDSGKIWTIPMDRRGEYTINYRRNSSFNSLSFGLFTTALEEYAKGKPLPPACLVGQKTLLVGESEVGLSDLGPTPIEGRSPLPYTHLNVINNVLKNDYLIFVPEYWVVIGWALITWPTMLSLKEAPLRKAVSTPIALMVYYTIFAFAIFWMWSIQIALAWPILSFGGVNLWVVLQRWREEAKGREQVKQVFSRMLSPEVMNHLLEHPENVKMGGSKRAVTILFSDIRDYTKFSEGLEEEELVRQLNVYFERMVGCVQEYEGTLHKYIGDAIMCVWGDIETATHGPAQDARNAVRSALMMRQKLRELNDERQSLDQMPLRIGIGLNHGEVLVGLIGASSRSEFTVMGDSVNTASRLEGITKEFHTDLAISESVRQLIGDDFLVRRLGFIQLKGKTKATVVFEVLAEKSDLSVSRMIPDVVACYEKAFDDFLARRFEQAEEGFLACARMYPNDFCVQNYLQAIRDFAAMPPAPNWDGRIVMKTK